MAKKTVEVPEELVGAVRAIVKEMESGVAEIRSGEELDFASLERRVASSAAGVEREVMRRLLREFDIDAPRIIVDGSPYARVGRYEATYKTQAGPVEVERSLYRKVGARNAPTVDAISLRTGCVEDGWLPETAQAMAHLLANGTSREAASTSQALHRLPYSRCSFERIGHAVGALLGRQRPRIESALAQKQRVPPGAVSVSVSLDRVAIPMEEQLRRPVGRPRKNAPRRPINVAYRMAYAGSLTLNDEKGEAIHSRKYGRMPLSGADELAERMARDVQALLKKKPSLVVVVLTDGAPELQSLLDDAIKAHAPAADHVVCLVDFWHLMEKLGHAAHILAGAGAERLLERWKLTLLNRPGAAWRVATELRASGKQEVRIAERRPVHEAITYLENNGDRMAYDEARAQGLPIGTGNVEATCKSLFAVRMKRPGARWKEETGQHVVDLRSHVLSETWAAAMKLALTPLQTHVRKAA